MTDSIAALQLADWRRRVFGLYSGVRQLSVHSPAAGHELWKSARDELFAGHPQSPLLPDDRAGFTGLTVARYDPDWRFELEVHRTDEPMRLVVDRRPTARSRSRSSARYACPTSARSTCGGSRATAAACSCP